MIKLFEEQNLNAKSFKGHPTIPVDTRRRFNVYRSLYGVCDIV